MKTFYLIGMTIFFITGSIFLFTGGNAFELLVLGFLFGVLHTLEEIKEKSCQHEKKY